MTRLAGAATSKRIRAAKGIRAAIAAARRPVQTKRPSRDNFFAQHFHCQCALRSSLSFDLPYAF